MKKKSVIKRVLFLFAILITTLVFFGIGLVIYLTIREYQPEEEEHLTVSGNSTAVIGIHDSLSVLTFNVGYCALDKDHDFFMDGGKTVTTESAETVKDNISGISGILQRENPDVVFLQEVDVDAKRSYHLDETDAFHSTLSDMNTSFATNLKCDYIPYPFPETIGSVHGGLQTLNRFDVTDAKRIALPTSYTWPIRVCQLKRCLLVERVPLKDSEKELILINLHLEAYASGSAKTKQTKILIDLLKEEYAKGNYCIAGGDFNQTFSNVDTSMYPVVNDEYFVADSLDVDILPEEWNFATDSSTPTSRLLNEPYDPSSSETQYYIIDGYIVSPNVKIDQIRTLDEGFTYSDHNPVLLNVTLE